MENIVNLNSRTFRSVSNSGNGEVSDETIFEYSQNGSVIMAEYRGGSILKGNLLGRIEADGLITFRYQHFNLDNELRTGRCTSRPEFLPNGKLRLYETWEWTNGLEGSGESIIEEL